MTVWMNLEAFFQNRVPDRCRIQSPAQLSRLVACCLATFGQQVVVVSLLRLTVRLIVDSSEPGNPGTSVEA